MNLSRAAVAASATTVALWTVKAVVIAVSGEGNNILESIFFLAGLAACVIAGVLVGAALFARSSLGWRVLGALLAVAAASVLGTLVQLLVVAVQPTHPGWVWGEVNLWAIMLALLAVALRARRRQSDPPPAVTTRETAAHGALPRR